MLSFLVSIPIIAVASWFTIRASLRMWRLRAGWPWWLALSVLSVCGGYIGFRLGYYELQPSPSLRWVGLPLPIGFFALEGEQWTDFVLPAPVQFTNFLADLLSPILLLLIPLALVWRRREKSRAAEAGG